jgi:hypothetical protein
MGADQILMKENGFFRKSDGQPVQPLGGVISAMPVSGAFNDKKSLIDCLFGKCVDVGGKIESEIQHSIAGHPEWNSNGYIVTGIAPDGPENYFDAVFQKKEGTPDFVNMQVYYSAVRYEILPKQAETAKEAVGRLMHPPL